MHNMFGEIGVNINERDIQACHQLRAKDKMIVKLLIGRIAQIFLE